MRGWFQFGYDGFPSGELRRRFFRQRDDPCGSEEDNDYDDETNDRPVHYYPLRRSEEGSSSGSSRGVPSDEDADVRGGMSVPAAVPLYAHTTAYESSPALYGATAVEFAGGRRAEEGQGESYWEGERYVLWHGGASMVESRVSDAFTLARLTPQSLTFSDDGAPSATFPGAIAYSPVPAEASLEDVLHTPLSHPALRGCLVEAERLYGDWDYAPPRFGHAAAPVELPRALAHTLLTEGLPDPTRDETGRIVCPPVDAFLSSDTPNKSDYELHLSLIVGGTERLPSAASPSSRAPDGESRTHGRTSPASPASPSPPSSGAARPATPSTHASGASCHSTSDRRVLSHIRSVTMSRPALCFTLLRRPGGPGGVGPAHWTRSFELWGSSRLPLEPRLFATLTPWPQESDDSAEARGSAHTLSFVYLGGTETGLAPAPLFPLTVLQLDYRSWQWSARVVPAFGAEPRPRFGHSTTYCDGHLLVFGGVGRDTCFLNDLHILNTRTKVWREVFVPINVGLPPRAFHCAALLVDLARDKRREDERRDFLSAAVRFLSADRRHADRVPVASVAPDGGDECLTERPTGASLMILGGEAEGGVEASVWLCALDTASWQPCHFPLFSRVQSYHVGPCQTLAGKGEGNPRTGAGLSAHKLHETVHALVERQTSQQSQSGFPAAPTGMDATNLCVSTLHGSLAQAIPLAAAGGGGVLILGGTRSPPVLLATQLQLPHGTLRELVTFWLLASPHSLPSRVMRRAPSYYWSILGHTRFGAYVAEMITHPVSASSVAGPGPASSTASLTRMVAEAAEEAEDAQARRGSVPATTEETTRLVSQGALEEQLSVWVRAAKRRLREERFA